MPKGTNLSAGEREFCELVSRAVFANPFSDEQLDLHLKIAQCSPDVPPEEMLARYERRIGDGVRQLEKANKADIRSYTGDDRYRMQGVLLYEVFLRYKDDFDRLIQEQVSTADQSVPVSFAANALRALVGRGFTRPEAVRFLGMFYQVRRAFYFIHRGLMGESPCMRELRRQLWNNVFTHDIRWYEQYMWDRMEDFSTLLLGETGTGKGTAAAAIGRSGFIPFDEKRGCFAESFTRSFVSLNLSQYPETLIESELFGHKKGAFTGAISDHEGVFARCSPHGAIFLDEIGDLSIPVQIKLLQVLQERTFTPVGSHQKQRFRGRVLAATNKPLDQLRTSGQFRDDFYYRLCSHLIVVPPLRQRIAEDPGELDLLLASVIQRLTGRPSQDLVEMVRGVIDQRLGKGYAWPGNVRELEQAVRRILLTRGYEGDVQAAAPDVRARLLAGIEQGSLNADSLLSGYCQMLYERYGTYEEVARRTNLDRRTVKAYIEKG